METAEFTVLIILVLILLICNAAALIMLILQRKSNNSKDDLFLNETKQIERRLYEKLADTRTETARDFEQLRGSLSDGISARLDGLDARLSIRTDAMSESLSNRQVSLEKHLSEKQDTLQKNVSEKLDGVQKMLNSEGARSEQRFQGFESNLSEQLRSVEAAIRVMRETNEAQLDSIRGVVNEKLQQTLNERLSESFKRVDERLAEVYKGLGEMQSIASGVGDLKRVLSNVKTRGTLGEIQLNAILCEVLSPEQFEVNFDAGKGCKERVEFAVKLPNDGGEAVYLPIDSKFPADMYIKLNDAYDTGDSQLVEAARKALKDSLIRFAKDIHDKYINPPRTTNFAIMFLPTEGLYAEAVRLGLIETLQSKYKINIAGPSTTAALLNSLQLGFRTLAIQKRSSEVWEILANIKKEFKSFDLVLDRTRKALEKANGELEALVTTKTKKILTALDKVEELPRDNEPVDLLIEPADNNN